VTVLPITRIGDPVLRSPTRPISREELASAEMQRLIDDLIDTMRHAAGAGIAANQVGRSVRICAIEVGEATARRYPYKPAIPLTVLVNPTLEYLGDETYDNNEGCLSVPDLRGDLRRHVRVRATAWDRNGEDVVSEVAGLTAGTYQHEVDHLDGMIFVDRVEDPRTFSTWAEFDRHHREAFVERITRLVEEIGS
jgi:peptide deformylase